MQRMLCTVLSLLMISSTLSGCATAPVAARPAISGPQVYGYTLNQPLSGEQLQRLSDSGQDFVGPLRLYRQFPRDGSRLGLYADAKRWLDTVSRTSREFSTQGECQAEQAVDEVQLTTLIDAFNAGQARPAGAPRQVGDVYASQWLDACQRIGGQGPGAEAFHYTLWATLQTATQASGQGFVRKVEPTHNDAWSMATVVVLLPILLVATLMGGGGTCAHEDSPNLCDKPRSGSGN